MKKYRYYLMAAVATLSLTGCSSLLDEDPKYTQNSSVVFSTTDNAELALLGCYGLLSSNGSYGQMMQEIPITASGLSWAQRGGNEPGQLAMWEAPSTNSIISIGWKGVYKAIAECNAFIESIEASELTDVVKKQYSAEAKFIRAICYYNLVTLWGSVPLKTTASTSEGIATPLSPIEDIYNVIVSDLTEASDGCPATPEEGRLGSWAAKAFLGKVYFRMANLNIDRQNNLQKAKTFFDEVYDSNYYSLEPNFANLFGTFVNSDETIIQINYSADSGNDCYNRGSNRFAPQASTSGIAWSTIRVAKYNYDLHEGTYPGDPRLRTTFLTQWRTRTGNNQTSPKAQVGSELCPNDSNYTYPYWKYESAKSDSLYVPGTKTRLYLVAKMPYAEFSDPTNPDTAVLNHYAETHDNTAYSKQIATAVNKFTTVGDGAKWPFYGKMYDENAVGTRSHKNLIVYRYAEMLLLMADVYNELGNKDKAIELVNRVLNRARTSGGAKGSQPADWSSELSKEEIEKKLYYERIFELNGEPSIYDMVRCKGTSYMKDLLSHANAHQITILADSKYRESPNNFMDFVYNKGSLTDEFITSGIYLPIPSTEIDANPALSNN